MKTLQLLFSNAFCGLSLISKLDNTTAKSEEIQSYIYLSNKVLFDDMKVQYFLCLIFTSQAHRVKRVNGLWGRSQNTLKSRGNRCSPKMAMQGLWGQVVEKSKKLVNVVCKSPLWQVSRSCSSFNLQSHHIMSLNRQKILYFRNSVHERKLPDDMKRTV